MKHTPGPWKYAPEIQNRFDPNTGKPVDPFTYHWVIAGDGLRVACGLDSFMKDGESPNARLIAQAPAMLDLLEIILEHSEIVGPIGIQMSDTESLEDVIKQILKKIKGEMSNG